MFKNFIMKQMLKSKMKDVPPEMQDKIIGAMEKNPQLFTSLAAEIQEEMKKGKDQMTAAMAVMQKHKDELQGLLG
jgi:hypothetical protein